jgi:hypothetical protein
MVFQVLGLMMGSNRCKVVLINYHQGKPPPLAARLEKAPPFRRAPLIRKAPKKKKTKT